MCKKKKYCNPTLDECLREIIKQINNEGEFKTLASCCGHSIYPTTIIVKNKLGIISEYFSKMIITAKKRNRYYKKDKAGYYFIPEITV